MILTIAERYHFAFVYPPFMLVLRLQEPEPGGDGMVIVLEAVSATVVKTKVVP